MAAGRKPQALERYRGQATGRRHQGIYHYQRQTGRQPHPHRHAARKRATEHPQVQGRTGQNRTPLHQHQHVVSERHRTPARHAAPALEIGQIATYDPASGTAMVQLLGSPTRLVGPIPVTACAPRDLTLAGASCLVALLDAHNPRDGVIAALWPGTGTKLTQVGVASIAIAGASTGSVAVAFPSAYAAPPAVVATATDPAWTAAVSGITATGYTLTIRAAAPATANVAVNWIACGE
jgi:hypothetical protein